MKNRPSGRNPETLAAELLRTLERSGIKARILAVSRLGELEKEIEKKYREGLFGEEFYRERLTFFGYSAPGSLPGAKSIIVCAAAQPQVRVAFNSDGKTRYFLIPPTYSSATDELARKLILGVLGPGDYSLADARIPEKLAAVHSGLAQYGKNNIAYVEGMGSFCRFKAFFTDLPCPEDHWSEPRADERCNNCRTCAESCPAGAIAGDRFLIRAERCLTFHNEREGRFPEWIDPSWHNCLIGCMVCQKVCPLNREFVGWIEDGGEFSEAETGLILRGKAKEELPAETVLKIKRLYLWEDLELLDRNLGVLLHK
ncbi:MAG: epoxyqueuosine reductase [Candidatus Glassbacteria bacterium]|nr:epoxyqueuosine reductase [Candidatus Glassbacteria bacterium]